MFDDDSNTFTKSKIKSNEERKLQFKSRLTQIRQVEIKSARNNLNARHWIYLRMGDGKKIKFFFISFHNPSQIIEYTVWLCNFLGIGLELKTSFARKLFSGIV